MKKFLLAAAALIGVAAPAMASDPIISRPTVFAPAPVGPAIMGYAGVGGMFFRVCSSGGGSCEDLTTLAAGGALNVPLGSGLNVEIEAAAANLRITGGGGPSGDLAYSRGMVHGFMRNQGWAFGIYGGFENPSEVGVWTLGAEAQAYMGNITLYGQVATNNVSSPGGTSSFWSARGAAQLFLGDNAMLQGDVRWVSDFLGLGGPGSEVPALTLAATAEFRMPGTPWSVFGTFRRTTFDSSFPTDPINAGLIGFRANVGAASIFQQQHQGSSMNTLPLL